MLMTISDHLTVMGSNLVWAGMALPVIVVYSITLWSKWRAKGHRDEVFRILLGVILVALAGLELRGYWAVWRWLLENGYEAEALVLRDFAVWPTLVAAALVHAGYSLHLKPYLSSVFGRGWYHVLLIYTLALQFAPMLL